MRKNIEQVELPCTTGRNEKWNSHFGKKAVSLSLNMDLTNYSNNTTSGYLLKRNEICLYKDLYVNVHSSIIYNIYSPKLETTQMAIIWLNTLWFIHLMDYYSAMKRKKLLIEPNTMDESQIHAKWKKPDAEDCTLYNPRRRAAAEPSQHLEGWNVLCHDSSGAYVTGYICPNSSNCTFYMSEFSSM